MGKQMPTRVQLVYKDAVTVFCEGWRARRETQVQAPRVEAASPPKKNTRFSPSCLPKPTKAFIPARPESGLNCAALTESVTSSVSTSIRR